MKTFRCRDLRFLRCAGGHLVRSISMRRGRGAMPYGAKSSVTPLRYGRGRCSLKGTMRPAMHFTFGFPYRTWWPGAASVV